MVKDEAERLSEEEIREQNRLHELEIHKQMRHAMELQWELLDAERKALLEWGGLDDD